MRVPPSFFSTAKMLSVFRFHPGIWLTLVLLMCALVSSSFMSLVLFHSLIELSVVLVALISCFVALNTYSVSKQFHLLMLGCGYFWVGIINLLHALSAEGIKIFPELPPNSSAQFWMTARFIEALIFLSTPFVVKHTLKPYLTLLFTGVVCLFALIAQYNQWLMATNAGDYFVNTLLCLAAICLYLKRSSMSQNTYSLLLLAIVFSFLSALASMLDNNLREWSFIIEHVLKLLSFWIVYQLLVVTSFRKPVQNLSQLVNAYDASVDETIMMNDQGDIIHANSNVFARLGESVIGMHCHFVLHDTNISVEQCPQCEVIRSKNTLYAYEFYHESDMQWYEATISANYVSDNFSAIVHSRRCITQRKKAELQFVRTHKLYSVLSHTNKAIVEIKEADILFRKICEIAISYGEFKMAWIGIIEGDVVRPDYYAGEETGYLNEMQMRVDDSDLARGPVGIAAKNHRVACVNDVDNDPDFEPWRQAAQQRGYKALAAVPIKTASKVMGIFTLYSEHGGVFDEAMLSLLSNLSDDICAAYQNILLNKQQKESDKTIRKLSSAIEQGINAVLISNAEGLIEYVNAGFVQLSGYNSHEVIGQYQQSFQNSLYHSHIYGNIWNDVQTQEHWQGEVLNTHKDGSRYWTILSVSCIRNEDDVISHYVWSSTDNTKLHEAQDLINRLAFYDPLTELANRRLLMDRLDHALMGAKRHSESVAIIMCDLDNFKVVNDSLGHNAGDELLKYVASIMRSVTREDDLVARLGGDEFVIVLDGIAQISEIFDIAGALLEKIEKPLELSGNQVAISSSLGIAVYPDDGLSSFDLLRSADLAMYYAKENGKNCFQFYQHEMNEKAQGRLQLEQRLRKAIEHQDFELWYQPQVDIATNKIMGFEALVRWRENGVLVPPNEFIPLAEETGMIEPLGDWVLQQAYQDWQVLNKTYPGCSMAVNVSGYQFKKSDHLFSVVKGLLEGNETLPNNLYIIELTESTLIQNIDETIRTLNTLKALGVSLSIDDFGTGYSSLSRLKKFPINQLKIDRSFINDLLNDDNDKAIVAAIIAIAKELGLKLVAEGVELQGQADALLKSGCTIAQGFHYFKPMQLAELLTLTKG